MSELLQNGRIAEMMRETTKFRPFSPAPSSASKAYRPFGHAAKRHFLAAAQSRLTFDWPTTNISNDEAIARDLSALRGRSRWLADNNGYYQRFISLCVMNIVGPTGIRLEAKVQQQGKTDLDTAACQRIEMAWKSWRKLGVSTKRAKWTGTDLERVIVGTVVRDGEVFLRKWFGEGDHGYKLEMIDPMRIPTGMNRKIDSATEIINGIEYVDGEVVAYYISPKNTASDFAPSSYTRVEARYMMHLYFPLWVEQKRGVPWLSSGMQRLHMMDKYEHAEVVAARVAAENGGGFFKENVEVADDGFTGDGEDGQLDEIEYMDSEAGTFGKLPPGWEFQQFKSDHPNSAFEALHSKLLRGISASGNVPYFSFANDLGDVNYSTARVGILEVQDNWREKQQWLINWYHEQIYTDWLRMAITSGAVVAYASSDFYRYQRVSWAGRGWSWIDPEKEAAGNLAKLQMGSISLSDIAAEQGKEFEDVVDRISQELEIIKKAGINLPLNITENDTNPNK